ncbi:MAG: helix-turn-helix transcriptional regulator [Candidatus Devosia phytovorans]|uniref:Helix-turn-helix transcriptional regulator n=1 Tax=Candidatus Devosia phytovorans TaxID=3121372 RepID=A0AAJ5VUT2_9HYPH|nr:helix-turn-helix transcriptional regulator [Devosia sp.]WEK03858.1 MAG: helix-turn-helix transcriptional regulator [Devosia sp.]
MLAFAEDYLRRIRAATNDTEIIAILGLLAGELGYRSSYLIEYASTLKTAALVLDSSPWRMGWWEYYASSGLRPDTSAAAELLTQNGVIYFNETRFSASGEPMLAFARRVDMVNAAMIPIRFDEHVAGLVGLCGERIMTREQEKAVQFVCYSLFSQSRSFLSSGIRAAPAHLTPREKEVVALSSEGHTAQEVAEQLGMSPRTVSQHMDNAADKLGTRNRVHTVAEAIRRDLL